MRFVYAVILFVAIATRGWSQDLAIVNAVIYASPTSNAIPDATILIKNGKIVGVGRRLPVPGKIVHLDCRKCVVLAGFWNTHVHFTEPKWTDAAHLPAIRLERQLEEMLTHSGFTTVVDTGSDPANTVAIRSRIESGEVRGPRIYTAGLPLYPPEAIPYYLGDLPAEIRKRLLQPNTPAQAATAVDQNIAAGSDITKLFTGSFVTPDHIVPMPIVLATAAVMEAHRQHQLVFAHTSNLEGTRVALESGVDVLAHAPEATGGIDSAFVQSLVAHRITMIPTLKLFSQDSNISSIRAIVSKFQRAGGTLMFGTDTGFLTDYDLGEEYRQLSLAGLNFRDILAMLTTAPAERFAIANRKGRIATGMDADLTVLGADPASVGSAAFTNVRYTIRGGRVVFSSTRQK